MTEIEGELIREETRHLPAVRAHEAMVTRAEVSVDDVIAQRGKIKDVMAQVMVDGVHYGRIPGVSKPTLFKSGAEVLNTTFRLAPSYQSERMFHDDGHLTVIAKCVLTHAPSGMVLAEGEGMCSSRELKYAWRSAGRVCPICGAEAIIKGKQEYGGGWLCWKNHKTTPGCGMKFQEGDPAIEGQATGKVTNPDLPDTWNTVLKMADKRALVAAVLNGTAASDIFTQDVEDSSAAVEAERVAQPSDDSSFASSDQSSGLSVDELKANAAAAGVPLSAIGKVCKELFDHGDVATGLDNSERLALWVAVEQRVSEASVSAADVRAGVEA
jgi:hypothetical protein